jgi:hypothetical protein
VEKWKNTASEVNNSRCMEGVTKNEINNLFLFIFSKCRR